MSGETLESQPAASVVVEPTTDGRQAQAYVDRTLANASLDEVPATQLGAEGVNGASKALSLFKYNRIAMLTTVTALVAFALIGGGSWLLSSHKGANQPTSKTDQVNNYNVGSLDLKEVQGAEHLQVSSAEYLTINGQLQVGNTLVLAPMSAAPTDATAGQIYYDKATNAPYYYNGTSFISLAPQEIPKQQTIGAFVGSLQGQSGNLTLKAGTGVGISGLTVTNNGVTGLHGTNGEIDVSATNGDITLSLPTLTSSSVVATDGSGHLSTLTAATPGLCLLSTAGAPVFGSCSGSALVLAAESPA
jgi:hypothetical protein